jgi:hypothetical protein
MIFLDLSLKSEGKYLNGFSELINCHFFFTLKIQFKKPDNLNFHSLVVFVYNLKVIILQNFSNPVKGDQWISLEFNTVENAINLSADDKFSVLLLKDKMNVGLLV